MMLVTAQTTIKTTQKKKIPPERYRFVVFIAL